MAANQAIVERALKAVRELAASRTEARRAATLTAPAETAAPVVRRNTGDAAVVPLECCACRGRLFWRSIHGCVICWRCHPPGSESLIADLLWDGGVIWVQ